MFNEYMKYVLVFNTFLTLNDRKYISNLNFGRYLRLLLCLSMSP